MALEFSKAAGLKARKIINKADSKNTADSKGSPNNWWRVVLCEDCITRALNEDSAIITLDHYGPLELKVVDRNGRDRRVELEPLRNDDGACLEFDRDLDATGTGNLEQKRLRVLRGLPGLFFSRSEKGQPPAK